MGATGGRGLRDGGSSGGGRGVELGRFPIHFWHSHTTAPPRPATTTATQARGEPTPAMAKLGEGDERWIVKEREDGRNCNNWHWTTKDVSANTKADLIRTLTECTFEAPLALAKIKSAEVTGEASVNNRKGKIFLIYDFEVRPHGGAVARACP